MERSIWERLGLDSKERDTYLALLELGQTTTGALVKKTGIPSSKIYHVLDALIQKGVVGYIVQGKVKWFRANRPAVLRHLLDLREQEIERTRKDLEAALPSLEAEFASEKREYGVEILEGLRGIKSLYDHALKVGKPGDVVYTIGYPLLASQLLNAYFKDFHKMMARRSMHGKVLYDYDTWFAKQREPRPHAQQRYLPRGVHTPAFILIVQDYVGIIVVTEKQKTCIVIHNKEVADSYVQYFELLWKLGKEPN